MDILTMLQQALNLGSTCTTGSTYTTVANGTEAFTTAYSALSGTDGITNLISMICRLFGLGY
jgi:hypothetical protein